MQTMENPEAYRAQQIVEYTGTNLFLTGKAGTGKTTFLRRLRERSAKRMVVLAPTGIAAINAGGVTIHSFFQLPFSPYIPDANYSRETFKMTQQKVRLIRSLDLVVIDEISMVRADLLDSIDSVLRRYRNPGLPFGGVQLLLIGDLQQLAPVVRDEDWNMLKKYYDTPFFFSSRALQASNYVTVELKHIYRQDDPDFIRILNEVRSGTVDNQTLDALNKRYIPDFNPPQKDGYVRLVTHNNQAKQVNELELNRLETPAFEFKAVCSGVFPESSYPTDEVLVLKEGAQVMFVKNNAEAGYYNGMLGEVVMINKNGVCVRPIGEKRASPIELEREEWTNAKYALNEKNNEIEEVVEGTFKQYPLRLAWAITIHKSQGLTFERAIIDTHWAFAHGQTYVALSRCKSLEGMVLSSKIPRAAVICDADVAQFTERAEAETPTDEMVRKMQADFYMETVVRLFDFHLLRYQYDQLRRLLAEHFNRLFPRTVTASDELAAAFYKEVEQVAVAFHHQLSRLFAEAKNTSGDEVIVERIKKGAAYFSEKMKPVYDFVMQMELPTDNKQIKQRVSNVLQAAREALQFKCRMLRYVAENGFELEKYLAEKAIASMGEKKSKPQKGEKRKASSVSQKVEVPSDILHPELFKHLVKWRYDKSREKLLPAYTILQQKALIGVANLLPTTKADLKVIPYLGDKSIENYGDELLALVAKYGPAAGK